MFIKPFISTRATPPCHRSQLSLFPSSCILHSEYCPMHILLSSFWLHFICSTDNRLLHPMDRQLLCSKVNGVWKWWRTEDIMFITNFHCAVCSDISCPRLTADGRSIDTKWSFPSWEFSMTILLCGSRAGAASGHHWASLSPHFKFVNHISGWVAMSSFYFVGMFRKKTIIRPHLTDFERMPG